MSNSVMILLLRVLNSPLFVFAHVILGVYFLQRFFRALKTHYQLMDETMEFSRHVEQCRSSLDYVTSKVAEAMKEIEEDIAKEVSMTQHLTQLSTQVAALSKRFNDIEEGVVECARLGHNMETPSNISEEVKQIFQTLKNRHQVLQDQDKPLTLEDRSSAQSPKRRKVSRSKSRNTENKLSVDDPDNEDDPQPRRRLRKKKKLDAPNSFPQSLLNDSSLKMSDNSWENLGPDSRPRTPNFVSVQNFANSPENSSWDPSRPRTPAVGFAQNSIQYDSPSNSPAKSSTNSKENPDRDPSKPRTSTLMPTQNSPSAASRKNPSRDSSMPRKPTVRPTKNSIQQSMLGSSPAKSSGRDSSRPRTPGVAPTVDPLKEKKAPTKKTIGFRPTWTAQS